jgi:diguanylate cyclase
MTSLFKAVIILIDPMLLAVAVIYVYGVVVRLTSQKLIHKAVIGLTFGIGAILAMLTPLVLTDGFSVDTRCLLVGLSGAFFGIPAAVIAGGLTVAARIAIGGDGLSAGITAIALATCAGPIWARYIRNKVTSPGVEYILLGFVISSHLFAAALLPQAMIWSFLTTLAPILVVFNLLGAILVGTLIAREEGLIVENLALRNAATTDPLTRLHNRRSAVAVYKSLPPPRKMDHGTAMLCFDVDKFKTVNDTYGHVFGDKVLEEISRRISLTLRPSDVFSRLGGDEFLIILPSVTEDETSRIAERCREVIAQSEITHEGHSVTVTVSIGAEWLADRPDFMTFVARADEALYRAKNLGRNCVSHAWENVAVATQSLNQHPQKKIA